MTQQRKMTKRIHRRKGLFRKLKPACAIRHKRRPRDRKAIKEKYPRPTRTTSTAHGLSDPITVILRTSSDRMRPEVANNQPILGGMIDKQSEKGRFGKHVIAFTGVKTKSIGERKSS